MLVVKHKQKWNEVESDRCMPSLEIYKPRVNVQATKVAAHFNQLHGADLNADVDKKALTWPGKHCADQLSHVGGRNSLLDESDPCGVCDLSVTVVRVDNGHPGAINLKMRNVSAHTGRQAGGGGGG